MLNEPTIEKLRTMNLEGMLHAWEEQQRTTTVAELSFDERFGLLVDAESSVQPRGVADRRGFGPKRGHRVISSASTKRRQRDDRQRDNGLAGLPAQPT